jgi:hypothetical protein
MWKTLWDAKKRKIQTKNIYFDRNILKLALVVALGETLGTSLLAPLVLATVEPKLKNELGN